MDAPIDSARSAAVLAAFQMPSVQTMVSRKSSITNAFVNSVIPSIFPSVAEIDAALRVLSLDPLDLRCSYCGDRATEWDHLRPLVVARRPTGFISEIANLVPACGKCNQSKGNKAWRVWMLSAAPRSPTGRGITGTADRIARLEAFEQWRAPTRVDPVSVIGVQDWEHYWSLCEEIVSDLAEAQIVADAIKLRIAAALEGRTL